VKDDEKAWQEIVDHYGDVPEFPAAASEPDLDAPELQSDPDPVADLDAALEEEDRFVPPPPPPLPRPEGPRLLAWLGVFVAPIVLMIALMFQVRLPSLVSTGLVLWFLCGFGYLVWNMPRDRDDPYDDGARL
jgi:hypothetical protein